jgi:ATP-dependent DNA helicase RecG
LYAPAVQYIKYNEQEEKVNKIVWDDHSLNPKELIEDIWDKVSDWKEGIEIQDGLFRHNVANYDEVVVRELLANALVHRPYTIRGDIFINLYPDRMEIHNPGTFPLGVTPQNILHKSVQRNTYLAKVFYDLKLMEKEGSGYDKIYATLLSAGKPLPKPEEGRDRVSVTVEKRIVKKEVIRFMENVNKHYGLKLKEIISLGLIAQNTSLMAVEFARILDLDETNGVRNWLGNLLELGLVKQKGRTKGTTYFVDPELLRELEYQGPTDLKNIAPHRLRALIKEDLEIYGESAIARYISELVKKYHCVLLRVNSTIF